MTRNIEDVLSSAVDGFSWTYSGITNDSGSDIRIPPTSTCVSAIFEDVCVEKIRDEIDANIELPDHTRQYPDLTIHSSGEMYAVDIKTAQREGDKLSGRMTLGNYSGYFSEPDNESAWTKYPYSDYDKHCVVALLYSWDESEGSRNMVSDISVVIGEKWEMASKRSGSGTTSHIGSIKSVSKLEQGRTVFDNADEFEAYWR